MMDFHAHMNMNEVIGLLAGECHEDRRLIRSASSAVIYLVRRAEHAVYELMPDCMLSQLQVIRKSCKSLFLITCTSFG